MPVLIASTTSTDANYPLLNDSQTRIVRAPNGVLAVALPKYDGSGKHRIYTSVDGGNTWVFLIEQSSLYVNLASNLFWDPRNYLVTILNNDYSYYWAYNSTTQTFSGPVTYQHGDRYNYDYAIAPLVTTTDIPTTGTYAGYPNPLGMYWASGYGPVNLGGGNYEQQWRIWSQSSGAGFSDEASAIGAYRVCVRHNGDGFTPVASEFGAIWVGLSTGLLSFRKYVWEEGIGGSRASTRTLNVGQPLVNVGVLGVGSTGLNARYPMDATFTGTQWSAVGVYNDGTGPRVKLWERNVGDTTTTSYTAGVLLSYRTIYSLSLAYDKDNNLYCYAVISDGAGGTDSAYTKFTRATLTWGAWTTVTNNALQFGNLARGAYGDIVVLYGEGSQTNKSWYFDLVVDIENAPLQPTWVTASQAALAASPLTLQWLFNDADRNQSQAKYALKRTIAGAVTYWDASLTAWVAGEVANTSTSTQVTLPASWATTGDAVDFSVKTWDPTNLSSSYSANLRINAATKVNPAITEPTAGLYSSTSVTVKWTCADQGQYKIDLRTISGTVFTSGWILNAIDRQYTIPYTLARSTSYSIDLTTRTSLGLTSDTQTTSIDVLYSAPAAPALNVSVYYVSSKPAAIKLFGQADNLGTTISTLEYYRRVVGTTSNGVLVGSSSNPGKFIDWSVASNINYEYRCASVSSVGIRTYGSWRDASSAPQGGGLVLDSPIVWDPNAITSYTATTIPNSGNGLITEIATLTSAGGTTYIKPIPARNVPFVMGNYGTYYTMGNTRNPNFAVGTAMRDFETVIRFARSSWTSTNPNYGLGISADTTSAVGFSTTAGYISPVVTASGNNWAYLSNVNLTSLTDGTPVWVRIRFTYRDPTTALNKVEVFQAADSDTVPTVWTLLSTTYQPWGGISSYYIVPNQFTSYLGYTFLDANEALDPTVHYLYAKFSIDTYANPNAYVLFDPSQTTFDNAAEQFTDSTGNVWKKSLSTSGGAIGGLNTRGCITFDAQNATGTNITGSHAALSSINLNESFTMLLAGTLSQTTVTTRDQLRKTNAGVGVAITFDGSTAHRSTVTMSDGTNTNTFQFSSSLGRQVHSSGSSTLGLSRDKSTYAYARGTWAVSNPSNQNTLGTDAWWIVDVSQLKTVTGDWTFLTQNVSSSYFVAFSTYVSAGTKYLRCIRKNGATTHQADFIVDTTNRTQIRISHDANNGNNQMVWRVWTRPDGGAWYLVGTSAQAGTMGVWPTPATPPTYVIGNSQTFPNNSTNGRLYGFQYGSTIDNQGIPVGNAIIDVDFHNRTSATTSFTATTGQSVTSTGTGAGAGLMTTASDWFSAIQIGRGLMGQRTNLIANPSFEFDVLYWTSFFNSTGTFTRSSNDYLVGRYSALLSCSSGAGGAASMACTSDFAFASAGSYYTASAFVKTNTSRVVQVQITYYNSTDTQLSFQASSYVAPPTGTWTRISTTFLAPTNTYKAKVSIVHNATTTGDTCYVDAVMLEQTAVLDDYFDGDFYYLPTSPIVGYTPSWSGVPYASSSTAYPINLKSGAKTLREPSVTTNTVNNTGNLVLMDNGFGGIFKGFVYSNRSLTEDEIVAYHKFAHGIS